MSRSVMLHARTRARTRLVAALTSVAVVTLGLGTATPAPAGPVAVPASVTADRVITVAGSLQSELGCPADWQPSCPQSELTKGSGTSYSKVFDVPAGAYELKVTVNGGWDENYGAGGVLNGPNIPLRIEGPAKLQFDYDDISHVVSVKPARSG
jgi:hypothetical protein